MEIPDQSDPAEVIAENLRRFRSSVSALPLFTDSQSDLQIAADATETIKEEVDTQATIEAAEAAILCLLLKSMQQWMSDEDDNTFLTGILRKYFGSALRAKQAMDKLYQNRLTLICAQGSYAWTVLDEYGKELHFGSDPVKVVLEAVDGEGGGTTDEHE